MSESTRAIIMAAGKGTRLRPLTEKKPKPLIPVLGVPMIESVISALHRNGITQIYIVTGYLKEQFAYLPKKYHGVSLLENPDYDTCNNISSLYAARNVLGRTFIIDGDQIIRDPAILRTNFQQSGYCCHYTAQHTDEWLLTLGKDGAVNSCSPNGGENGWQLYGVSFWTQADGEKLALLAEQEFAVMKNRNIYWDHLALLLYPKQFRLSVREISGDAVCEADSLADLQKLDPSYSVL